MTWPTQIQWHCTAFVILVFFLFFSNCFKCCEHSVNKSLSDNALTNILFPGFVSVPAYWKIWFAIISRTLVVHPEYMIEDRINHENILDLLELTFISWFPVIRLWGIPRYSVELEIDTYKVSLKRQYISRGIRRWSSIKKMVDKYIKELWLKFWIAYSLIFPLGWILAFPWLIRLW